LRFDYNFRQLDSQGKKPIIVPGNSLDRVISFCSDACDAGANLKSGETPWELASDIEKDLSKRLSGICKKSLGFKPAKTLRAYLTGLD
jgi:hypothetical protein